MDRPCLRVDRRIVCGCTDIFLINRPAPKFTIGSGGRRLGLAISYVAGVVSGLLGIGGGALKVPAMNVAMGIPIKVATATSNLMIGVTAAASAGVYFMRGDIDPFVAAPVAAGVLVGATGGLATVAEDPQQGHPSGVCHRAAVDLHSDAYQGTAHDRSE